jgi:hypothetical protein
MLHLHGQATAVQALVQQAAAEDSSMQLERQAATEQQQEAHSLAVVAAAVTAQRLPHTAAVVVVADTGEPAVAVGAMTHPMAVPAVQVAAMQLDPLCGTVWAMR